MRVCHYAELLDRVEGGIRESVRNQRRALDAVGIPWGADPREDHDVLHLNLLGPRSLWHLARAQRRGVPVVVHTHTTGEDFRGSLRGSDLLAPLVDGYTRRVYARADALVAPSAYTRDLLRSKGLEGPIHVVSNGVDPARLQGVEDRDPVPVGRAGAFTALNVGLVFERKGLETWLACARRLPEMDFVWFGPPVPRVLRRSSTRKRVAEAPPNAHFPGFVEDVRDAFAQGDVFLFPTLEENQGMSLLEAAHCGLPIVVRDLPTYQGWLTDGEDCLKARSVNGFVAHLEALREDAPLRERLGASARRMAGGHGLDDVGERLEKVYTSLLG